MLKEFVSEEQGVQDGSQHQNHTGNCTEHKQSLSPPGLIALRHAQVLGAALGTCFGSTRINVQARTELDVVAPAAVIAKQGLSACDVSARETIPHLMLREGSADRPRAGAKSATRSLVA